MQGFLTQQYQPTPIGDVMSNHGSKMCKVIMQPGVDIMAKTGSMVAYKGLIDFNPSPPSMSGMIKSWATGEGVQLMQCTGQGELYLADYGSEVVVMQLANEALSVNGPNILAFQNTLQWGIERIKDVKMAFTGQGMFNVVLRGQGWVALTSRGTPAVLDTREAPTFVDTDALVAYTEGLSIQPRRTAKFSSLIPGRGSGEAFQLGFQGQGFVVVQPAEEASSKMSFRG